MLQGISNLAQRSQAQQAQWRAQTKGRNKDIGQGVFTPVFC